MITKTTESKNNWSAATSLLPVKSDHKVLLLKVDDIDWIESGHNFITLRLGRQSYRMRGTLGAIELRLPKDQFIRISRFNIVQINRIKELELFDSGDCQLTLHSGAKLPLSRRYRKNLRRMGFL